MTLQPSAHHRKQRWLSLFVSVLTLTVVGAGLALGHGATSIPGNYTGGVQEDVHGANDVPGQVDVTQMGRDTSEDPDLRIFWAWDSISSWTGNGQTGDACALFDDNDVDAFIDYVVCARVQNLNADPGFVQILPASTNHPAYIFDCSNKKDDRCTNPAPRTYTAGLVVAGPLDTLSQAGIGNLITETDPFNAQDLNGPGESFPHDSTIDLRIDETLVPANVRLANVCSYPSAGNGGNNNPFDCIVTPGIQYGTLRVTKTITNDNGGSKVFADFSFTAGSGAATTGVIASTAFDADGSIDTQVPVGTYSVVEVGTPITGYTTSYSNCTSVSVTAGNTTTCAITNDDQAPSLTLVKEVTNDNGGTALPAAWTLTATGYDAASPDAGTYTLSESGGPAGYTQTSLTCSNSGTTQVTSVTLGLDEDVTCTFVNDDQAPSLTLVKEVTNDNGGTALPAAWTLTATGYDAASPDAGTYTLSESGGPAGYTQTSLTCSNSGTTQVTSVTLGLDEDVTCTFVNDDQAPSLTLVKEVTNDNGGTALPAAWTLTATGYDAASPDAGTYTLSESGGPAGYTQTSLTCSNSGTTQVTSVTLGLDEDVTCTFVNDDDISTPAISTVMKWTLNDRSTMAGWVPGGTASTVTFTLYKDTATESSCEASTQVFTQTVNVNDANGSATTTTGHPTEEAGTYRWIASFSGNSFNAAIASDCTDEVTVLP